MLGPVYFVVFVLVVGHTRSGAILQGALIACVLSCCGLFMLFRSRTRA